MRVNNVTVWRPEGASDGKPILVEHDMAMVHSLPYDDEKNALAGALAILRTRCTK
jgi:hypothetical protein